MSLQTELLLKDFDANALEIFDTLYCIDLAQRLSIQSLSDNIFLKEKETDILAVGTKEDIPSLVEQGYEEIPYEEYTDTIINSIVHSKEVTEYKTMEFKNTLNLSDLDLSIGFKDNIVNITKQPSYELVKSIEYDFNIDKFFIDQNGFVYILTGEIFIKSHISMEFYKYVNHQCATKLEDIKYLYKIKLNNMKQLLYVDDYYIYYIDKYNNIIECELGRKYYFIKDNQVFFNVIGNTDRVTVQVEHTHFYDWISILGLNTFYIGDNKLSTKYTKYFKNIIKFKFDSTLNGILNYSDFLTDKSYKVDKDIDFIKIEGNFNYDYKQGLYEIVVRADKTEHQPNVNVTLQLIHEGKCIKSITGNTVGGIIYFCNLKFIFYKTNYETVIRIPINVKDKYSAKIFSSYEKIDEYSMMDSFIDLSKIDQSFRRDSIKHQLIETDYENGHFIIKNYIKDSKSRNFTKDFKVRFIEKDGSPSILWRQIKDKDYFLKLKNYMVIKKIKPKKKDKPLLSCNTKTFKINLGELSNRRVK